MITETIITIEKAKEIFHVLCSDFSEAVRGKAYSFGKEKIETSKVDNKIIELATFFTEYESDKSALFLTDLQVAFSKENIKNILVEIRKEGSWNLENALRIKLTELCHVYNIVNESSAIVDNIIEMFFELTSEYDPEQANKLFYNRLYNQGLVLLDKDSKMIDMLTVIDSRTQKILMNQQSYEMKNFMNSETSHTNNESIVGSNEDLFSWNLKLSHAAGLFNSQENRKKEVLELIEQWSGERLNYPGWFIAPVEKREILLAYTQDEELLWNTNDLSFQNKLDFLYEIVWRYETGMLLFDQNFQRKTYDIWQDYCKVTDWKNTGNNQHWFYIGQVLLREFREDMNWEEWASTFSVLMEKNEVMKHGTVELTIEYIKQLFTRMQITDVRDKIQQFNCPKECFPVRLQKYGIMAECGLIQEAYNNLKELIDDILDKQSAIPNENSKEIVYLGSLLSCVRELLSLVIQGLYTFEHADELAELWENQKIDESYFDFEHEKYHWKNNLYDYFCKHDENPFELDRNIRVNRWGGNGFEKVYGFYRVLDSMAIPLHLGMTRLLSNQEIEFDQALTSNVPLLGCYMLLRTGNDKAVKSIISRKFCIQLGFDHCRKLFDYVYSSVEQNINSIRVNPKRGNAYAHLLNNGLEILKRLVSIASLTQQKMLVHLMCKLIDTDVMQEFNVMDRWIHQVLDVVDEKIKAQFLNEILMTSTKNRSHITGEKSLDPFEVITLNISARKYYENAEIDSSIIDDLILRAQESDEERKVVVSRLEKLYEWGLLSEKQTEQFRNLIWIKVNEGTGLPDFEKYFGAAFLKMPCPDGIDIAEKVRKYILNPVWFEKLKNHELSGISMGKARIFDELRCLNSIAPAFLTSEEKSTILRYFVDYWKAGREKYEGNQNREFYLQEFTDRYCALSNLIGTFTIEAMDNSLKQSLSLMFSEMKLYNISVIAAESVIVTEKSELPLFFEEIIDGLYSTEKNIIADAINGAENIIRQWPGEERSNQLLEEIIRLIRYGRQPGLQYCFIVIHNLAYCGKLNISEELLVLLNKALIECNQYSVYEKVKNMSENDIKDVILLRCACARTANLLSKYITNDMNPKCKTGIEMWEKLCIGENSKDEFAEVKRAWLY